MSSDKQQSDEIIKQIIDSFFPVSDLILLEGSYAYGRPKSTSDIDIEIVTSSFNKLVKVKDNNLLQPLISAMNDSMKILEDSQGIDRMQIKTLIKKIPVGLEITRLSAFKRIANTNLVNLKKEISLLAIRNIGNIKPNQRYLQRTFNGKLFKISKTSMMLSKREITFYSAFLLTNNGHFMPGPLVDRYICGTKILVDKKGRGVLLLEKLKDNIVRRFLKEYPQEISKDIAAPFRCVSRWDIIPSELQTYLLKDGIKRINSLTYI